MITHRPRMHASESTGREPRSILVSSAFNARSRSIASSQTSERFHNHDFHGLNALDLALHEKPCRIQSSQYNKQTFLNRCKFEHLLSRPELDVPGHLPQKHVRS